MFLFESQIPKQPSRVVLREMYSKNMQPIYRIPMSKWDTSGGLLQQIFQFEEIERHIAKLRKGSAFAFYLIDKEYH